MSETQEVSPLQRKALASLGRNVLHFHRLEAQLKLLVLFYDFSSPLDQFAANHKKQAESIRMKTMGNLVAELHERLYGKPADPSVTDAITQAHISFQFRVDADPNYLAHQKQKLNDLVIERNQLIHQDLATFDPASAESCRLLIARLDEQNERILIQLKAAQQLVHHCRESFQEMLTTLGSEEWRRGFNRPTKQR